ncbi:MAG: 1-acyl-sn-glycerol-3-phosphate acyltransferase [Spirochaetales bacterium]|nr:1-acyl-sn-glycerol-3-phosphate acyltransferase [Spirochaetales bacterium]
MKQNPVIRFLNFLRAIFVIIWVIVSTVTLAILCVVIRIFGETPSRVMALLWFKLIAVFGGVKIKVNGLEKLDPKQQYILVANHQSYLDILSLYLALPFKLAFIAKKSLFAIPFFGWAMRAIGHISIDRSNPKKGKKSIEKAVKTISKTKKTIFAFPEGTRSTTGEVAEFKLGIFTLAMKTDMPMVPIAIQGAREMLSKKSFFLKPGTITLTILDPIDIQGFDSTEKTKLANTIRDEIRKELGQI